MITEQKPSEQANLAGRLLLTNLLNDFETLANLLPDRVNRQDWLNAYLLAAGMSQILDDYLHPDPFQLAKVAKNLGRLPWPAGPVSSALTRATARVALVPRFNSPETRFLCGWQAQLVGFVEQTAAIVASGEPYKYANLTELKKLARSIVDSLESLPGGLRHTILRLPSCFRSFDQQPADLARIVGVFSERWPERNRLLLVAGIRTSGSYLAPLYRAFLRRAGYTRVSQWTVRPGRSLYPQEISLLKRLRQEQGLAILVDDPPVSGQSVAATAHELARAGFRPDEIVLFLPLFGPVESLPACLKKYPVVVLPWQEWAVQAQLAPAVVGAALAGFLVPGIAVSSIEAVPLPPPRWNRSHARGYYRVQLTERSTGREWEQQIFVKGAGLGYFGDCALAVARRLSPYFPHIYGLKEGLFYRDWLPEEIKLSQDGKEPGPGLAAKLVDYVVDRHQALPVKEDFSLRVPGRRPVWEAASEILVRAFVQPRPTTTPLQELVHPVSRALLKVETPSVIDGSMALANWFEREPGSSPLTKVDFDYGAFCNRDLYCYDPIYDLACLAASAELASLKTGQPLNRLEDLLEKAYRQKTGERVLSERWLLYRLVYLGELKRLNLENSSACVRACARVAQDYYSRLFFQDLPVLEKGDFCALDIDGVLETEQLGFPALTPASAMALRALVTHGYRPLLASGRSLPEIQERCRAYHLPGGTGEYGSVFYNHLTGEIKPLLSPGEQAGLGHLRTALGRVERVQLDPDFHYAVRAYRLDAGGNRRGLPGAIIKKALAEIAAGTNIRPIPGDAQTDFMYKGVNKGTGLQALIRNFTPTGPENQKAQIKLAIGDTISDLPMFRLANFAVAPAHAAALQKLDIPITARPYQAGLALGVEAFLGHFPGACPTCRCPVFSPETRLLLDLLGAMDKGVWGKLKQLYLLRGLKL